MTSVDVIPAPLSRQAIQAKTASAPKRVTGKLKIACDLMVYGDENKPIYQWDDAARQADLSVRAMRLALERPHVRAYLKAQQQVFRDSICAGNPRRLQQIRDQDENKAAAVRAIQVLERIDEEAEARSANRSAPGVTINIMTTPSLTTEQREIEAKPLIEHADVRQIEADNDE
jgi:hypothetical protein